MTTRYYPRSRAHPHPPLLQCGRHSASVARQRRHHQRGEVSLARFSLKQAQNVRHREVAIPERAAHNRVSPPVFRIHIGALGQQKFRNGLSAIVDRIVKGVALRMPPPFFEISSGSAFSSALTFSMSPFSIALLISLAKGGNAADHRGENQVARRPADLRNFHDGCLSHWSDPFAAPRPRVPCATSRFIIEKLRRTIVAWR